MMRILNIIAFALIGYALGQYDEPCLLPVCEDCCDKDYNACNLATGYDDICATNRGQCYFFCSGDPYAQNQID